jgi:hypothetical protein
VTTPACTHSWKVDWDELVCVYCGTRLYPNENSDGPRWRAAGYANEEGLLPNGLFVPKKNFKGSQSYDLR